MGGEKSSFNVFLGGVTAKLKDLTGLIFGRWKVIERAPGRRMGDGKLRRFEFC